MKKLFSFLSILVFAAILSSCGNPEADKAKADSLAKVALKDSLTNNISKAEKALKANKSPGARDVNDVINAYSAYTNKYPTDTITPEYLLRESTQLGVLGDYKKSADVLEVIINEHKNFRRYDDALWLAANIYATYLPTVDHGDERAKQLYEFIIQKYPGSNYAQQSAMLIKYIGVPADSMYNDIQRNNPGK